MQWHVGLVALLFIGTAAAQLPDLPELPDVGLPTPGLPVPAVPVIPDLPPLDGGMVPTGSEAYAPPNGSGMPGAPVLEYQHAIWRDGQQPAAPADGYDLIALRAWEVDIEAGAGLVLRLEVVGRASGIGQYVLQGDLDVQESNATPTILLWTDDGIAWQSDGVIVAQDTVPVDATGILPPAQHHVIHLLVSYDMLNATVGQTIDGWAFTAYTDSDAGVVRTDIAPGGYFIAGGIELPEPNAAGELDDESLAETATAPPALFLRGAGQHLGLQGSWAGGVATLTVSNPYIETAQTVALAYPAAATATASNGTLPGNSSLVFRYGLPQRTEAYTVGWEVRSDIGGVAMAQVTVPALPPATETPAPQAPVPIVRTDPVAAPQTQTQTSTSSPTGGQDSPGVGVLALLAIVAATMWLRKR